MVPFEGIHRHFVMEYKSERAMILHVLLLAESIRPKGSLNGTWFDEGEN